MVITTDVIGVVTLIDKAVAVDMGLATDAVGMTLDTKVVAVVMVIGVCTSTITLIHF